MRYTVQSWHKFKFIITPSELREVLGEVHLKFIPDTIRNYYPQNFFEQYDDFYDKLKSGYRFVEHEDLYDYYWHAVLLGEADDEPGAELLPFEVWEEDGKWYARDDLNIHPENIIGFLMKCPKELCIYENEKVFHAGKFKDESALNTLLKNDEEAVSYIKCDEFECYEIYKTVVSRVKKISKQLSYEQEGKIYKPSVWISAAALKDAANFYFFKSGVRNL